MSAATSCKKSSSFLLVLPMLTPLFAGCGGSPAYPADMNYPVRSDLLVIKPSKLEDFYPDPPGHLDQSIEAMVARAKKEGDPIEVLDPKSLDAHSANSWQRH